MASKRGTAKALRAVRDGLFVARKPQHHRSLSSAIAVVPYHVTEQGQASTEVPRPFKASSSLLPRSIAASNPRSRNPTRRLSSSAAGLPPYEKLPMPSLSPTMTQGNIARWCKEVGDELKAGEVLCEIETDKATLSLEVMDDGYLAMILVPEGAKDVDVGEPIAVIVDEEEYVSAFKGLDLSALADGGAAAAAAAPSEAQAPAASSSPPPSNLPSHLQLPMPSLSPTMTQGNIAQWLKQVGDEVKAGDVLCEIETDKATLSLEAMDDGYLAMILVPEGAKDVPVGDPIAVLVDDEESVAAFKDLTPESLLAGSTATSAPEATPEPALATETAAAPAPVAPAAPAAPATPPSSTSGRVVASPAARKLASEKGIHLASISGSGPGGRITKEDVEAFLASPQAKAAPAGGPATVTAAAPAAAAPPVDVAGNQKAIAELMTLSIQTVPHFYLSVDVPTQGINQILEKINDSLPVDTVSLSDVLIKVAALACRKVPACNSAWGGDYIRQYSDVNIAISIFTPHGTFTPVIKGADKVGVASIAAEVKRLTEAAHNGTLTPEDLQGATFTITDVSGLGVKASSGIIHPPQAALLTIGEEQARIVMSKASPAQFDLEPFSTVTLSCDHRVVDGAVGAEWLAEFKKFIDNPISLLL